MARKKKQNKQRKVRKTSAPGISLKERWALIKSSPAFRFLVIFAILIAVFYLIYYSSFFEKNILDPYVNLLAAISGGILNLFGGGTSISADVVQGQKFGISIKDGCDGVEVMAYFLAAVAAFPVATKLKLPGLGAGLVALILLNIVRICGLYLTGVHKPEWFDFLHIQGGFFIFTAVGILIWFVWANWVMMKLKPQEDAAT